MGLFKFQFQFDKSLQIDNGPLLSKGNNFWSNMLMKLLQIKSY